MKCPLACACFGYDLPVMYQPIRIADVAQLIRQEFQREDSDPWLWVRRLSV